MVKKLVVDFLRDGVCLRDLQRPVYTELDLGQKPMTDPPRPDLRDGNDSRHGSDDRRELLDGGRVDRIEQSLTDTPHRLVADNHDRSGDDQADHRVRPLRTQGDGNGSHEH